MIQLLVIIIVMLLFIISNMQQSIKRTSWEADLKKH